MAKKVFFVTGPIGSGKSTATEYLKSKGFLTIDLDIISNEILQSTRSANFLLSNFPEAISKNAIDKQKLANIVFKDSNKLKILEDFLHTKIQEKLLEILKKTDLKDLSYFKDRKRVGIINNNLSKMKSDITRLSQRKKNYEIAIIKLRKKRILYVNNSLKKSTQCIIKILKNKNENLCSI